MGLSDYISKLSSKRLSVILVFLIVISYINSFGVYFLWDDYSSVVLNADIRSPSIKNMFKPIYPDDNPDVAKIPVYYRPLQVLSYSLDYQLWKLNPFGYHITNIILHTANALLLFLLLIFLFKNAFFAFCGSALFGTHPVFTSSVTYISGRADILSVFFLLLMVIAFIKSIRNGKLNLFFYGLALFCSFLMFLSKEIGVTGILFLVLLDKLILKYSITKERNLIYAPFVLAFLYWQHLKPAAFPGLNAGLINLQRIPWEALTLLKGMSIYTFLSIIPFHLRMGRTITAISTLQDKWVYIAVIFLIMIVALYLIGLRKNKLSVVGLSWFYLPLLVMVFFNYLFANRGNEILLPEHNLYFCYPGFVIFLFSTISIMKLKINTQKYLAAVFLVVLAFYAGSTISENFIWQDEIGLFKNNMKYNKDSAFNFITYANLGLAYERAEKLSLAEENLRLSAEKSGGNPYFYNLLASFYIRNFKFDQAIKTLTYSKELDENFYSTYLLLGISYAEKRQDGQALQNFQKARMLNPSNPIAERYLKILENTQVINESG